MNIYWFKRIGFLFIPRTIIGWIILLAALAYTVFVFIDIDKRSHSVSDTLMNFAFNFLIIYAVYSFIAMVSSRPSRKFD